MKFVVLAAALMLVTSVAFANHHEEKEKKGHDKEHSHVDTAKMDHPHDQSHHDQKGEVKKEEKKK